ncbi:MAG: Flp pilus assembly complex ATPase component TadA [Acidobacteria bacterium]|nr:Flp pilus assembly complex ATPase component TadA [Acidobacteriota bacterium]MCA1650685.1 Flp pilus assembly complex ATPase component TadA [Acidobacteriota bacterium]
MNLLDSLLDAIARLEGDTLVMHVGEKPYVVTTTSVANYRGPLAWGQVELSSKVLTCDAVLGMLTQILPVEIRQELDTLGAIEYHVPAADDAIDRFTVLAARGGDDVWLEVRRKPRARPVQSEEIPSIASDEIPSIAEPPASAPAAMPAGDAISGESEAALVALVQLRPQEDQPFEIVDEDAQSAPTEEEVNALLEATAATVLTSFQETGGAIESVREMEEPSTQTSVVAEELPLTGEPDVQTVYAEESWAPIALQTEDTTSPSSDALPVMQSVEEPVEHEYGPPLQAEASELVPVAQAEQPAVQAVETHPTVEPMTAEEPRSGIVVPISRSPIRAEPPSQASPAVLAPLERTLRVAAARGASTVYVVAHSKPMIRVDGEISPLESEPVMTAPDVERLLMDLSPPPGRDPAQSDSVEWMCDVPDVGRVRCVTFRDHRGPGVIFRMVPPRAISADQLGLSAEVQALAAQPDGLVLVAGARASGKSTLLSAFVDLINRTRSDHVITIESQVDFVHESRRSFVSQREVRGASEAAAAAIRSALREDPDVLVIEDLRTPEITSVALAAAESGRLVFGSVPAVSTVAAVERILEMLPPDRRSQSQTTLAGALRGVVAQVLLRKVRGGRIAAREVLLNTAAVAGLIMEGKTFQLPVALDSGRRHGMMPLNDSLASLVREGTIHASEAYRKALDRDGLLAALKREGVDTSFAERLA